MTKEEPPRTPECYITLPNGTKLFSPAKYQALKEKLLREEEEWEKEILKFVKGNFKKIKALQLMKIVLVVEMGRGKYDILKRISWEHKYIKYEPCSIIAPLFFNDLEKNGFPNYKLQKTLIDNVSCYKHVCIFEYFIKELIEKHHDYYVSLNTQQNF
jgi:hypothetical protein